VLVRGGERMDQLAIELEKRDGARVRVLAEDLADPAAPERIARTLGRRQPPTRS
jgi:short-subunit dehydrogenase